MRTLFAELPAMLADAGDTATDPIPVEIETPRGLLVASLLQTGRGCPEPAKFEASPTSSKIRAAVLTPMPGIEVRTRQAISRVVDAAPGHQGTIGVDEGDVVVVLGPADPAGHFTLNFPLD